MSVPTLAFFNNKGGVGKTSLVYHLAWMYAELGLRPLAADLDPQANLTTAFLDEDRLEELWPDDPRRPQTIYGSIEPLLRGIGDLESPHLEKIGEEIFLLVGDLALSRFEDELSQQWPRCLAGEERAFRVTSAFGRLIQAGAAQVGADIALVDLGPNLGAINRAGLLAGDFLVVPLAPDLFSLQGLKNLGPTVGRWRKDWVDRRALLPAGTGLDLSQGEMKPLGYVVLGHAVRLDRPVKAYEKWAERIPSVYAEKVNGTTPRPGQQIQDDPNCLALLKHYRSLMPMAQEARKPIFALTAADGAIGAHLSAVKDVRGEFDRLAREIARRSNVHLPA